MSLESRARGLVWPSLSAGMPLALLILVDHPHRQPSNSPVRIGSDRIDPAKEEA
jgi:hypothetical protein